MKGGIYYVAIATVIFSRVKITCYFHLWRYQVLARKLTWYFIGVYIVLSFLYLWFPLTSLTNIAVISLDRMHATIRPFRHRLIKKWVYGATIAGVWVLVPMVTAMFFIITLRYRGYYMAARRYEIFLRVLKNEWNIIANDYIREISYLQAAM